MVDKWPVLNLKANLIPAYFGVAPSIVYQGPDLIYIGFTERGPLKPGLLIVIVVIKTGD